ncbi:DNA repair protein RadC [Flavobacterium cauense R2A-7]|uniref:DNA repair protein RadC n=2 Tax=Flavobacterium TaxID=237 RepID=A0A562LXT0_9FLAO|nr:DNA repair protein RadC [Flavobacterium cauense R2A-7]
MNDCSELFYIMENTLAEIQVSYNTNSRVKPIITSSHAAYELLQASWTAGTMELQEEFKVLLLNRANNVLGIYNMSRGGGGATVVDVKLLFAVALKCNATSIIISHNHPSGKLEPSSTDKEITKKIKSASEFLEVKLLDHIIVTKNGYYSFADNGIC